MIRVTTISIFCLIMGFYFYFLGSFFAFPFASYLSGICFIFSLYFYKKITPFVFLSIFFLSFLLFAVSSLSYILASLFPLIGFLFSGENKYPTKVNIISRYALLITSFLIFMTYYLVRPATGNASDNLLSVMIAYAILAEILYFDKPSYLYVPLILISFFVFGNRSSVFLLAVFIRNKVILLMFLVVSALFVCMTLGLINPPSILNFLFDKGGLLYRSFKEPRFEFIYEFFMRFNFLNLLNKKWVFYDVLQTSTGFYNFHNSFLNIIVRDGYGGLLKVFLWFVQIFVLPLSVFIGITLRASFDSFLLGGINDILVYALIGRSIRKVFRRLRVPSYFRPRAGVMHFNRKPI
jgi:hypothetical protein